jgi:hypothetical protein
MKEIKYKIPKGWRVWRIIHFFGDDPFNDVGVIASKKGQVSIFVFKNGQTEKVDEFYNYPEVI